MGKKAGARLAAERETDPRLSVGEPPRPSGWRWEEPGHGFSEGATPTSGVAAVEAPHAQAQPHGSSEARQVGGVPIVSAMDGGARRAAGGTTPTLATWTGEDNELTGIADDAIDDTARKERGQYHAQRESPGCPFVTPALPRKTRESHETGSTPVLRLDLLSLLWTKQELIHGKALGGTTEAMTLEFLDHLLQPVNLGFTEEASYPDKQGEQHTDEVPSRLLFAEL